MKVETGYLYFLKDEFYTKIDDETVMSNKGIGHSRPTYFVIRDGGILWFIPLSKQIKKYQAILKDKKARNKSTDFILIRKISGNDSVILIQNAFPTLEKYIDKIYTKNGKPVEVAPALQKEILEKFKNAKRLKYAGINVIFPDIVKLEKMMLAELKKDTDNK